MGRRRASFWEAAAVGDDPSSLEVIDDGMRKWRSQSVHAGKFSWPRRTVCMPLELY